MKEADKQDMKDVAHLVNDIYQKRDSDDMAPPQSEINQEKLPQQNFLELKNLKRKTDFINFMETNSKSKAKLKIKSLSKNKAKTNTRAMLNLDSSFKNHAEVVERINEMNLGWKAANYEQFQDLTISQINKFSGRKKSKYHSHYSDKKKGKLHARNKSRKNKHKKSSDDESNNTE